MPIFGICFILYFLKSSACHGFNVISISIIYKWSAMEKFSRFLLPDLMQVEDLTGLMQVMLHACWLHQVASRL